MSSASTEAGPSTPRPRVEVSSSAAGLHVSTDRAGARRAYDVHIPSNLVWMAPSAAMVGFFLGARRGGARARLRFLAENAHRAPKTVQGWYFYTKTRNYRVMLQGLKTGTKYAAYFGGAMAAFIAAEEGAGWLRERLEPPTRPNPNQDRYSWRIGPVHVADGAVAGGSLAFIAGLAFRLPTPLLVQGVVLSTLMGGFMSGLQHVQDDLYPEAKFERAAKEAVDEVADGEQPAPESVPESVPELGDAPQADKAWWSWK